MTQRRHWTPRAQLLAVSAATWCCASAATAHPLVVRWSDLATQATASSGYEEGMRAQAIAALAAFDAVNACERRFRFYRRDLEDRSPVPAGGACAAPGLMVASAYTTVLSALHSARADAARTTLADLAAAEPDADKREAALAHGQAMALDLLRLRVADRVDHLAAPLLPAGPGVFTPAPGRQPYSARASTWQPFALRQVAAHQPPPPPAPDSPAAQADLDEVRQLGAQASQQRSADQSAAAIYWNTLGAADHAALRRPWLKAHGSSLIDALRTRALFALVAVDTMVAESTWHWQFQRWRPQQALAAQGLADWVPLLATPNGPEYPSGVAIWAGALGTLQARLPAAPGTWPLAVTSSSSRADAPAYRQWPSADALAHDAAHSRLWAGVHTRGAVEAGLRAGRSIAEDILAYQLLPR
jgi:hypothetical protein